MSQSCKHFYPPATCLFCRDERIAKLERENAMRKAECERVWALQKADNVEQLIVDLEAEKQRIAELERLLVASWDDPDYRVKRPKLFERVRRALEDE